MEEERVGEWFYIWVRKNVYNNQPNKRFFLYDGNIINDLEEIAPKILKINSEWERNFYKKINSNKKAILIECRALKKVLIKKNVNSTVINDVDRIIRELMNFQDEEIPLTVIESFKRRIIEIEISNGINTNFYATLKSMLITEYFKLRKMVQNEKNNKSF